jgi:hypothetical protein
MKNTDRPFCLARLNRSSVGAIAVPISFVASACELGPKVTLSATMPE